MPVISVIVPVYNVEKHLRRCIDSILTQTFRDFECILIDDGSPDNCPVICDEYAVKDSRIIVIHQENAGVSVARNAGLLIASGEWIGFVDSDDWLEPEALKILIEKQIETNADIVRANMRHHFNNYTIESVCNFPYINNANPLVNYFLNGYNTLCATLYNANLFHEYYVPEISIGEDTITNVQIFSCVRPDKICSINDLIYNYDCRINGVTTTSIVQISRKPFIDNPYFKCRLFVEEYLYKIGKNTDDVMSAFSYDIITRAIIPYIISSKCKVSRDEINIFYKKYWKKCAYKYLIDKYERRIIPIYYASILLGKIYLSLRDKIIIFQNIIISVYKRLRNDGVIKAFKYYLLKYVLRSK